jgi:hypothetical protein
LYRALAVLGEDARLAEVYRRLAATEERHAGVWEERLRASGAAVPARRPGWRTRLPASLSGGSGVAGSALGRLEGRHRAASGNALRAAVLGANDGRLSNLNFGLVMGVAGAQVSGKTVLVTGLAGLLAGAGSMAMGEWVSVQSARELAGHQLAIEARELEEIPAFAPVLHEHRREAALVVERQHRQSLDVIGRHVRRLGRLPERPVERGAADDLPVTAHGRIALQTVPQDGV